MATKRKQVTWVAPPGSNEAKHAGCTCSTIDNIYGRGRTAKGNRRVFVVREGCPLHGIGIVPVVAAVETKAAKEAA